MVNLGLEIEGVQAAALLAPSGAIKCSLGARGRWTSPRWPRGSAAAGTSARPGGF